ncbi:TonB-dependent receptor [uncultured Sphingomonas sp.]|uniref:TonB-dependent receptor domain-containing protein n=1 Tax=uncultured Sphingomonas sp. TaxID=158754 RepID=UPI0025D5D37C|nr:TonB-dependent receptor [uncultured Sphingomonas sp.]
MKSLLRTRLCTTTLLVSGALLAMPAMAQDAGPVESVAQESDTVVVTGSRIARPDVETAAPITSVGPLEIAQQAGSANIENVLNDLPQFTPTTTAVSNNPGGGVATANLRALGAARNLVLVDGRRYMSYSVSQLVDLNTIPSALIERVDVVTGGRSAVYGSDAISGVLNFITKKDFQGAQLNSSYTITERGDSAIWDINGTIGANVDGGRGNVVAHVGYLKRRGTFAAARDFSRVAYTDAANPAGGRQLIVAGSPSGPQTRVLLSSAQAAVAGGFFGTGSTTNLDFNRDGSLGAYIDTTDSYNFAPVNYLQVPQERWLMSMSANYEVSPAFVPYIEGQFVNNRVTTELAATPIGNSTPFGNSSLGALRVQTNSPFLAANVRAGLNAIDQAETTSGLDVRGDGYVRLTSFGYRTVPLGPRQNNDDRNAYRVVAGARGDIGSGWDYDGYYMYARTRNAQRQNGNISISNFLASINTVFQSGTTFSPFPIAGVANGGTLVCADASARAAGCVPSNIFGEGNISSAAINYLAIGATNLEEYETEVASFALTNSNLFDLGGGGVGIAVGAEWRRENGAVQPDQFLSSGNVAGFNPGRPTAGGYSVREVFGELNVPVVRDGFIHLLEFNAAGRISDYSNAPGTVGTYAFGGRVAPIKDISFRGQYSRAIRGPSVNELFLGNTVSFSGNIEGCGGATAAPGGSLYNFCLQQGIPAAVLASATDRANLANATIVNPPTFLGGNANLREEAATTWTVGGVLSPSFLPGFSVTVDYWNIRIKNYISRVGTANIGTACFTNQIQAFCNLITRNAAGQIERIDDRNANSGGLKTSGIDVGANYSIRTDSLFENSRIGLSFNGTWLEKYDFTPVVGLSIVNQCAGRFGRNCGAPTPKWKHSARVTLGDDGTRFSAQWRYVSAVRDDNDAATFAVERLPSASYVDLTASFNVGDTVDFNVGVSNLFDKQPPILASAQSGGSGEQSNTFPTVYDVLGRSFFVSTRLKF